MYEEERASLMELRGPFDCFVENAVRATTTWLIMADHNRYSVDAGAAGRMVLVRASGFSHEASGAVVGESHSLDWQTKPPVIDFVTGGSQGFGMAHDNRRIRIGVTGHRPNRFPASGQDRVRAALPAAFAQFRSAVEANCSGGTGGVELASGSLTVVSSLAEGADRIVAAAGLVAGFDLAVILPFTAEESERDFDSEESKADFRALLAKADRITVLGGQRAAAEDAYYRAGLAMLNESDAIITVWDGEPAHGKGGTAAIVQEALRRALPVLWFKPDGSGPFDLGGRRELA